MHEYACEPLLNQFGDGKITLCKMYFAVWRGFFKVFFGYIIV